MEKFERKIKDIKIEGKRKSVPATMYAESVPDKLPRTHYTETEIKTMYMGMESEARKQY